MGAQLWLTGGHLPDGTPVEVAIEGDRVAQVHPAGTPAPAGATTEDVTGHLLLTAPAEPHAHLDKALLADRVANPRGDLEGAVEAMTVAYASMTEDDIYTRARQAVTLAVAHGYTAIRSHADLGDAHGLCSARALLRLRADLADVVDLEIVALVRPTLTGPDGAANLAVLRAALEEGVDTIGGAPHLEPDPARAQLMLLELAAETGRPVDLHTDEVIDPTSADLAALARWVLDTGHQGRVTASHCVSLGVQDLDEARRTADLVARAGIGIVTLPQTNLYLQGRGCPVRTPRGLTAVELLRAAGATVAVGSDNWRDPFNPVSRIDTTESAALAVAAAHLTPADAWHAVTDQARTVLGLEPAGVRAGAPAELLALRGTTLTDAIAAGSADRVVVHRGRVVARTSSRTDLDPRLRADPADRFASADH